MHNLAHVIKTMLIMIVYAIYMINSVFKRLKGDKSGKQVVDQVQTVDISRVIPGYKPPVARDQIAAGARQQAKEESLAPEDYALAEVSIEATPEVNHDSASMPIEEKAEMAVNALSSKHDAWAQSDLASLTDAWIIARQNSDTRGYLADVTRAAHNLKGMAATYGHPAIARLASSLCHLLGSKHAPDQHALINLHIEACRAAYLEGNPTKGGDAVAQSVCVALETQVRRTLEA